MTLNATAKYTWPDFNARAVKVVDTLFASYPVLQDLKIERLILRYIDAIPFDPAQEDVLSFLETKLKLKVLAPNDLFDKHGVDPVPQVLQWQTAYPCASPRGSSRSRLASGKRTIRLLSSLIRRLSRVDQTYLICPRTFLNGQTKLTLYFQNGSRN